jgi:hypothetical protein
VNLLDDEGRKRAEQIAGSLWQGDLLATSVAVTLEAPGSSVLEGAHELDTVDEAVSGRLRHSRSRRVGQRSSRKPATSCAR